jgi:hypothetical protein
MTLGVLVAIVVSVLGIECGLIRVWQPIEHKVQIYLAKEQIQLGDTSSHIA